MQARPITVTIRVRDGQTSLRVKEGERGRVVARLGSADHIHRLALVTILEGLSLWFQRTLHVALIADSEQIESWTGLVDGLGFGLRTLHFEVEPVRPRRHLEEVGGAVEISSTRRMWHVLRGV
jgi:hypothetical protein